MIFSAEALEKRKKRASQFLGDILKPSDAILVYCGDPIQKPGGLDQTYHFLPHPIYFWLTGERRPWGVVLYNKELGWVEFQKPIGRDEIIWEGAQETSNKNLDVSNLESFLKQKKIERIFSFGQVPSLKEKFPQAADEKEWAAIKTKLDLARRIKDSEEVQLIEKIAAIANKGYQKIKSIIHPGLTEREIQIEYEAEIQRAGAHKVPYETIVGSGSNAAILHAIPTLKKVQDGEIVLIDAGADVDDYCVDITRVLPINGRFSTQQKEIYDLVMSAQSKVIENCRIGNEWHDVHLASARIIADGLKNLNILRGNVDSILETGAISVFYPHGVGHLVGLRVRDTGHEENQNPKKYCGVTLRIDFQLQENYLVTAEPGCYFIKALIQDSTIREKFKDFIRWDEADKWLNFGGVRIEDDVLVTQAGPRILTSMVEK